MTDVYGNICDPDLADFDRVQVPIDDFEPAATADRAGHAAARDRFDADLFGSLFGEHRHARAGVEHEPEILLRSIHAQFDHRPEIWALKRHHRAISAFQVIERSLLSEVAQK